MSQVTGTRNIEPTGSPGLVHHGYHWGAWDSAANLPNAGGDHDGLAVAEGDIASVGDLLYKCEDPTDGSATWTEIGTDPSSVTSAGAISGTTITGTGAVQGSSVTATTGGLTATAGGLTVTAGTSALQDTTVATTLAVTGASTFTGGIVADPPLKVWNHVPLGALASRGTDAARTAGTTYYSEVFLPANKTITGLGVLQGTTVGTDKILVALYDSAGVLLANSAVAGVTTSGADTYLEVALTAPYAAKGPARLLAAVQINGTTDGLQFMTTLGVLCITGSEGGSFGTILDPITSVATTHTDNTGPMVYLY